MKNEIKFRQDLLDWYHSNGRDLPWRRTREVYPIWLSEVLLQQTQVTTVIPYYHRIMEQYPGIAALAGADLQSVLKLWEGLGYYARAHNFHKAARLIVDQMEGRFPEVYEEIRRLPGIGDYSAAAIASIAFGRPRAVLDGNVKRVLARLSRLEAPVNDPAQTSHFQQKADSLLDRKSPGLYNQALMELGALVCKPRNPLCGRCPVKEHCRATTEGMVADYPRRLRNKSRPEYQVALGVIRKGNKLLITRRKNSGLLAGLWEFPGGKLLPGEKPEEGCLREITEETGLSVQIDRHLTRVKHSYTHFRIVMDVFLCNFESGRVRLRGPVAHRWVAATSLKKFPFPGANRKFIPRLLEVLNSGA